MIDDRTITWKFDLPACDWDALLSLRHGHPLQSALWGEARRRAEGVEDKRWAAFVDGEPVWMGRFEIRKLPFRRLAAWLPRGPLPISHPLAGAAHREFLRLLKNEGFLACFENPYPGAPAEDFCGISLQAAQQTLWVDLVQGKDALFNGMHKKLRYGVRAAQRAAVLLEETRESRDVSDFFELCGQVSDDKGFSLPGSERLLHELVSGTGENSPYKAHLFVARCNGRLASGYFSIENGHSLHNIWNGTDRSLARDCPGEAVLWHQVAWGVDAGLKIYDQEGIDFEKNPGCYHFKKRLGGNEIVLPGVRAYPLGMAGKAALVVGRWMGKI